MRSSESTGFVPGARIPLVPPADGVFAGWDFPWVRENTLIQFFENEEILNAALSGDYTNEIFGTNETIFNIAELGTGTPYVWDGGYANQFFTGYSANPEIGGWASWANVDIPFDYLYSPQTREYIPGVYTQYHYSLRRFTSYLDIDLSCYSVDSAFLVSEFPSGAADEFVFPLNDSLFVFVNGTLAYWTSTDLIGSGNVAQNRLYFEGIRGVYLNNEFPEDLPPEERFVFTDGWYLRLGGSADIANIAPFLKDGKNIIDVIADDYYFGGGMSRINVDFTITPNNIC